MNAYYLLLNWHACRLHSDMHWITAQSSRRNRSGEPDKRCIGWEYRLTLKLESAKKGKQIGLYVAVVRMRNEMYASSLSALCKHIMRPSVVPYDFYYTLVTLTMGYKQPTQGTFLSFCSLLFNNEAQNLPLNNY